VEIAPRIDPLGFLLWKKSIEPITWQIEVFISIRGSRNSPQYGVLGLIKFIKQLAPCQYQADMKNGASNANYDNPPNSLSHGSAEVELRESEAVPRCKLLSPC
jgi:hypothetical protein